MYKTIVLSFLLGSCLASVSPKVSAVGPSIFFENDDLKPKLWRATLNALASGHGKHKHRHHQHHLKHQDSAAPAAGKKHTHKHHKHRKTATKGKTGKGKTGKGKTGKGSSGSGKSSGGKGATGGASGGASGGNSTTPTGGSGGSTTKQLRIYPTPSGEDRSKDYSVTANGKDVFCYTSFGYNIDGYGGKNFIQGRPVTPITFCPFDFEGSVTIQVTMLPALKSAGLDTSSAIVRPLANNIKANVKNGVFSFSLNKPTQITVEAGGSLTHPLHIFANPMEVNPLTSGSGSVTYFGPGVHTMAPTTITSSNHVIYLAAGAVVEYQPGSGKRGNSQTNGGSTVYEVPPLISANSVSNIVIRGRGILSTRKALAAGEKAQIMVLSSSNKVTVEGVTLRESGGWTCSLSGNTNTLVDNVKVIGHYVNNDGIVVSSSGTTVQNSFIHNGDDAFQIKSWGGTLSNIKFTNNIAWAAVAGAFVIPAEVGGTITGVTFDSNTVLHATDYGTNRGAIGVTSDGTGTVSNIVFSNINIEHVAGKQHYPMRLTSDGPIQGVTFSNINVVKCDACQANFVASGGGISNIKLKAVKILNSVLKQGDSRISTSGSVSSVQVTA